MRSKPIWLTRGLIRALILIAVVIGVGVWKHHYYDMLILVGALLVATEVVLFRVRRST